MRPIDFYTAAWTRLRDESALDEMLAEQDRFDQAVITIEFDPRFNAVNWMLDCFPLALEIAYSYCWMSAYAAEVAGLQGDKEYHIQYYADNCITRINSFRDKAALLAWAYYCPFNPGGKEKVLGFEEVLKRFRFPVSFGLAIKRQEAFITQLEKLQGRHFERMGTYRHQKIHRIEPKILLRPPEPSDGLSYLVPLFKEKEIADFKVKLKSMYPDDHMRKGIEKTCSIHGVLFDRFHVKNEYWAYTEVEEAVRKCTGACIDVAIEMSRILRRRAPLKRR